jgi:hypothetical protein
VHFEMRHQKATVNACDCSVMASRPISGSSSPSDRHPASLFSPALNANFQGNHLTAFGSPGKTIADLKGQHKAPAIFHRRRDGSTFASKLLMANALSLSRKSPSPPKTAPSLPLKQAFDPCEKAILKKIGEYGSAKHKRMIAHSARFDMLEGDDTQDKKELVAESAIKAQPGLTSAQIEVLKEMSLRSHSNSMINALGDKHSSVDSDAIEMWMEDIIAERNKFASAHLFAKAKLRECVDHTHDHASTGSETVTLCCCLADMITALSVTTETKAELAQLWGRLMCSVFQNWDHDTTVALVSQAHEPFLRNEAFKKILTACYQRHAYHDIAQKV